MALLSNISGTENVSLTKINACITTVNLFGGGLAGKIATKSSANDFDIFYADNAFATKSVTSNTIGTGSKSFDIIGSQWDDDFNFRVKVYSISSPGNYMEGTISSATAGYGSKPWTFVSDTYVGSGTFADWQFQVLNFDLIEKSDFVVNTTTFPNNLFSIGPVFSNGSLNEFWSSVVQSNKMVTITGFLRITALNSSFNRNITLGYLNNDYAIRDGNTGRYVSGMANVSVTRTYLGVLESYCSCGYVDNYNSTSTTSTILYLIFRGTSPTVTAGDVFDYNWSISYLTD